MAVNCRYPSIFSAHFMNDIRLFYNFRDGSSFELYFSHILHLNMIIVGRLLSNIFEFDFVKWSPNAWQMDGKYNVQYGLENRGSRMRPRERAVITQYILYIRCAHVWYKCE